ncbi:MAG: hypothetical protein GXO50_09785, partial [Chlorobi bacterium]|nr:hypothetical protein [Chlorobiota bacterium]
IETLSSVITADEYSNLKHAEFHHKDFNRRYNLISDFRLCEKNMSETELQNMIDIFIENKGKIDRKKSALLISNPENFKKIKLSGSGKAKTSHRVKLFTNLEDAEKWVTT